MKVHLYALCWNEVEMLPFFFRHYDRFVTRYFFYDDGSTDGSLELLRARDDVEVRQFERSDLESFTLSEMALSNECWKCSRGSADWVIVTDIDEHIFHRDVGALLRRYKDAGITIVPALGYQMISEEFPHRDEVLCETRIYGAPWDEYSKLSLFDPSAIAEIYYAPGRHTAIPTGRVISPPKDELMLLHYKYIGFERTHARQQQLNLGLGPKDFELKFGFQYSWSESELREHWSKFADNAIDVRTDVAVEAYPGSRWWAAFSKCAVEDAQRQSEAGQQVADPRVEALEEVRESLAALTAAVAAQNARQSDAERVADERQRTSDQAWIALDQSLNERLAAAQNGELHSIVAVLSQRLDAESRRVADIEQTAARYANAQDQKIARLHETVLEQQMRLADLTLIAERDRTALLVKVAEIGERLGGELAALAAAAEEARISFSEFRHATDNALLAGWRELQALHDWANRGVRSRIFGRPAKTALPDTTEVDQGSPQQTRNSDKIGAMSSISSSGGK
jgi:hypothetical protein